MNGTGCGETEPMTLIVGCPRSGTSLFAGELARRFDIVVPFETHFIPIFYRWRWLYGDLSRSANRRRMLDDMYLYTKLWIGASKTFDADKVAQASILATRINADDIVAQSHDYASLVHAIFTTFTQLSGGTRFADKSAAFRPEPPDTLERALGKIKIISIVRDGRDVYLSWSKTWFGPNNIVKTAQLWRRHVDSVDDWAARHEGDMLTVRYEDLVQDPDPVFSEVARFLKLEPRQSDADPQLLEAMASAREHSLLGQGIDAGNIHKYDAAMNAWQLRAFQDNAGGTLARHGYPPHPAANRQGFGVFVRVAWETLTSVSDGLAQALKRQIKEALPLIFMLGGRGSCRRLTRG